MIRLAAVVISVLRSLALILMLLIPLLLSDSCLFAVITIETSESGVVLRVI